MGLESSVTYINDLNELWPLNGDGQSDGAAHIRYDKKAMKNTFPNATRAYNVESMISRNKIINGGMDIWQRGTSFSLSTTNQFTADRWGALQATSAATTVSRQSAASAGSFYCMRVQRNSGSSASGAISVVQALESISCRQFQGKQVILSFKARKGANFSATASQLNLTIYDNTSAETSTNSLHTGTGWTSAASTGVVLTTNFQTFTLIGSISASSVQLGVRFYFTPTGTAGVADFFDITDVKIELGGTASVYEPEPVALEIARCQRHFYRVGFGAEFNLMGTGQCISTTTARIVTPFPVPMRTSPIAVGQTGTAANYAVANSAATSVACSSVPTFVSASNNYAQTLFTVASGLVAGDATLGFAASGAATAYLEWSADL